MSKGKTVTDAVLTQVAQEIHATAQAKHFWDAIDPYVAELNTKLMLIVSEVAEAQEVLRNNYEGEVNSFTRMTDEQGEEFIEEVADVIIRAFDLAQWFHGAVTPIGTVITAKMAKNAKRPVKHNKRF